MLRTVPRGVRIAAVMAACAVMLAVTPAQAVDVYSLQYEGYALTEGQPQNPGVNLQLGDWANALWTGGNGTILGDNSASLGNIPIQPVGKFVTSDQSWVPGSTSDPDFSNLPVSVDNSLVCAGSTCSGELVIHADFSSLSKLWQIVKIGLHVGAGTAKSQDGVFVLDFNDLLQPPTSPLQEVHISGTEYAAYRNDWWDDHNITDRQWTGVSNITLFGTPSTPGQVAEPTSLVLLGLGLVTVGGIARRKIKA
jgi:hypothetical protein